MLPSTSKLLPYQKEAIKEALENKRMLINLPAGSGKTLIGLSLAVEARLNRLLIICPAFLKLNWIYESDKWYPDFWERMHIVEDIGTAKKLMKHDSVFATVGYSFFQKKGNIKWFQNQKWDLIICDESHYLRKWESRRCQDIIKGICAKQKRLIFMTATPYVTSAADLHPTFAVMQPGKWGKNIEFKEKFCEKKRDIYHPSGVRYVGVKNAAELKRRAKAFVFSRKKKDILAQLPKKQIIDMPVDIGPSQNFDNIYDMLEEFILDEGENEVKTERERVGLAKVDSLMELIENFERSEQAVIFTWHRSVALEIVERLKNLKFKPRLILGGMNETKRMKHVQDFAAKKFKYFVVSLSAGGLGLNLQTASIAVFAEKPYSWAEFEQCCDRVHRIGSKKHVRIYDMTAVGSLDEALNDLKQNKREGAQAAGVLT